MEELERFTREDFEIYDENEVYANEEDNNLNY